MMQSGSLELCLPGAPQEAYQDGASLEWEQSGERRYQFRVACDQHASIQIHWQNRSR